MHFPKFFTSKKTKLRNTKPALFSAAELAAAQPKAALRQHKVAAGILAATLSVFPIPTAAFADNGAEGPDDLLMPSVVEGRPPVQRRYIEGECGVMGRSWKGEGFVFSKAFPGRCGRLCRWVVVKSGARDERESAPVAAAPIRSRKGKERIIVPRPAASEEPAIVRERYELWRQYCARVLPRVPKSSQDSGIELVELELPPAALELPDLPDLPAPSCERPCPMVAAFEGL